MADYQRILSYLYRYEKAEKKECLGFVKAEQKSKSLKLTIQINDERLLQGMELKLCFYERQEERWKVWELDTVIAQEHKEELYLTYSDDQLPSGFRIKGQSGVLLYYQDGFYYGSVWIGEEIPTEVLEPLHWQKVKKVKPEEESEEKSQKKVVHEDALYLEKKAEKKEIREAVTETDAEDKSDEEVVETVKRNVHNPATDEEIEGKSVEEEKVKIDEEFTEEKKGTDREETARTEEVFQDNLKQQGDSIIITESQLEETGNAIERAERSTEALEEPEISAECDSVEISEKSELSVDNFEKMWINSVKEKTPVNNIFNTAFYEGYKISVTQLKDFGEESRALIGNQFLLKGYERYKHLLAGKVRYAGEERYCVGVPGIYENREKYMAEIYQFPVFLSLTENRMKTGSFGYWLYLLKRE